MWGLLSQDVKPYLVLSHRALAAALAICVRLDCESLAARASPPFLPRNTAALLLPSSVSDSSISPVAIFITVTAFEITSAGRFWPLGPFGIAYR